MRFRMTDLLSGTADKKMYTSLYDGSSSHCDDKKCMQVCMTHVVASAMTKKCMRGLYDRMSIGSVP